MDQTGLDAARLVSAAKRISSLILFFGVLLLPVCQQTKHSDRSLKEGTREVTIHVNGLQGTSGQVIGLLFQNENGFPGEGEQAVRKRIFKNIPADKPMTFSFTDLPPGTYAVSVLHDENENERMDRSIIGAPLEGYGMSQNPPVSMGPPDFQDATFQLKESNRSLTVTMRYLDP